MGSGQRQHNTTKREAASDSGLSPFALPCVTKRVVTLLCCPPPPPFAFVPHTHTESYSRPEFNHTPALHRRASLRFCSFPAVPPPAARLCPAQPRRRGVGLGTSL